MNKKSSQPQSQNIALVGAPNSGKTTLYNWLTNSQFKTVNYPGATIEYSLGELAPHLVNSVKEENPKSDSIKSNWQIMDTPGTYSLHPKSADEEVTLKALFENPDLGLIQRVLVVIDGTQVGRQLQLAKQIYECGFPMMIVITMADLLKKQNIQIDLSRISVAFQCPVVLFDGSLAGGLIEVVQSFDKIKNSEKTPQYPQKQNPEAHEERIKWCSELAKSAFSSTSAMNQKLNQIHQLSRSLDQVLLAPFFGLVAFFVVMTLLFSSIFWLAAPLMDFVDGGFSSLAGLINGENLAADFLANGIIASFGAVFVFVPQIFILFIGITLLESSGYLARAATLIDRPLSKLGMSGRSFVPLLSGFACAVPALMATRNIPSRRDRWITNFIIPLMSCSARLPVYALLLAFLFQDDSAWKAGFFMAALYFGSLLVGGIAAGILHRFLPRDQKTFFMMELPLYRLPKLRVVLRQSFDRTWAYVKRAGPPIFIFAVLIWVGTTFPRVEAGRESEQLTQSYLGRAGKMIEPVFEPMGADWRVGVGLLSAFAAREVFVSSLALVFQIDDENEEAQQNSLLTAMSQAKNSEGNLVFTTASIVALFIFFMIALQCMSTFAMAIRESGSWKFAWTQLIVFNVVAYVLAVAAYQTIRLF